VGVTAHKSEETGVEGFTVGAVVTGVAGLVVGAGVVGVAGLVVGAGVVGVAGLVVGGVVGLVVGGVVGLVVGAGVDGLLGAVVEDEPPNTALVSTTESATRLFTVVVICAPVEEVKRNVNGTANPRPEEEVRVKYPHPGFAAIVTKDDIVLSFISILVVAELSFCGATATHQVWLEP